MMTPAGALSSRLTWESLRCRFCRPCSGKAGGLSLGLVLHDDYGFRSVVSSLMFVGLVTTCECY